MIRGYIRFLYRHSVAMAMLLFLATTFFCGGFWRLLGGDLDHVFQAGRRYLQIRVDTSDDLFLAAHDPELKRYRESTRLFGDDRFLIALLEFDDVFKPDPLALIARLTEEISRLPGAKRVTSLTHEPLYAGIGKRLSNAPLSARLPKTPAEAEALRPLILSDPLFVKHLVSADARSAAIYVRTWPHVKGHQLDYLVRRFQQTVRLGARSVPARFAGNHIQTIELHQATQRELKRLLPISALIIAVFLLLMLKSIRRAALLLALMVLSLLWTFGCVGWLGRSITPIDVILPTLFMTLCTTYALQFMTRHMQVVEQRLRMEQFDRDDCVERAAADSFFPLFLAQLTTAIGAASLMLTDIPAIRQFGLISSLGILFTAALIVTFLPLVMRLLPARSWIRLGESVWMSQLADLSQLFHRRKGPTLAMAFGLTLVLSAGIFYLRVENDPKTFFKPTSPIRESFAKLETSMGGALSVSVVLDGGSPGSLKDPEVLRWVDSLQSFAAHEPNVLKTLSFVDTVKRLNRAVHADSAAFEIIPRTREEVSQLLLLASFGSDPSNVDRFVDYDYQRGRLEIRIENAGSARTLELAKKLQSFMDNQWPGPLSGYVTGDYYMSCRANDAILRGQVKGFFGTVLVIFLVMWVCFESPKVGFLAMIPNVAPIGAVLGIMGYLGVNIDIGTALLASVALGIALDDTIHFIVHYMRSIHAQAKGQMAIKDVVVGVGRAMVYTNVSLALGFSILLFSEFAPVRLFGLFMIVAMAMACFDDFVMMPGLLGWMPLVGIWDHLRIRFRTDVTKGIPLFGHLTVSDIKKIVSMGRMMTVPAQWPLMREGTLGDEMFVILDGSVTVMKSEKVITKLGRGETVGEMGLISEHPRSADVIVNEETTVFAFGYEALDRLERRYPRLATRVLHNLADILSVRLADTTDRASRAG